MAGFADVRKAEAKYCMEHPAYFVETYVHIEDKDAAELIVPFKLWDGQKKALQAFANDRLIVVLKARQLGFTWLALAEASRLLALNTGRTVVGLSRTEDEAKELVRRWYGYRGFRHLENDVRYSQDEVGISRVG